MVGFHQDVLNKGRLADTRGPYDRNVPSPGVINDRP